MDIQRKALYNLLRMNWLLDPDIEVDYWQVEDYRSLSLETLFRRLAKHKIQLDTASFVAFAENYNSPEELSEDLTDEAEDDIEVQDQVYLLIFELWRRLVPEKLCLTIFCDELDYQISLYDSGEMENAEPLQDALANLQNILDENVDQGISPEEAFSSIAEGCANGLEDFIYDFTADQIDADADSYAFELLEGFYPYMQERKWFDFLKARLLVSKDLVDGSRLMRKLVEEACEEDDVQFNLEVLSSMVEGGERELFITLIIATLPLIDREEDFQELLSVCADYYQRLDYEWEEREIQKILAQRQSHPLDDTVVPEDGHKDQLLLVVQNREL